MASIAGIYSLRAEVLQECGEQVAEMLQRMHHRGPDATVLRTLPNRFGALGVNEVNLPPERTHCTSLRRPPFIVFDGELYNGKAPGQHDVEVFREYYEKHGKACFSQLDGSYVCAIVDDGELILARDQVGARPLFYGSEHGVFCFSSEMKGLIDHIRFDIHELPPAHTYSTEEGLKPFPPFVPEVPELGDIKQTAMTLRDLLIEAVRIRMDGVHGVALSGGLDSSIIATIAKEFNPDLQLFTVTVDSAPGPDLQNATLMADFLGLEHHIYRITDSDISDFIPEAVWYLESFDEDCISGLISNYYASRMAKQYSDYVLVGEGADELFGGYRMVLKSPNVIDDKHREELARKLLEIAYNTALRRLDRAWMANGMVYKTPFLDAKVVAFAEKIPMEWKIYGEKQVEKFILREAFRDMIPERIANREKLRFAMGVGTDDVMDMLVSRVIDPEEIKLRPKTPYGLPYASFKELYYYDEFLQFFPPAYEKQTVRWDPFK
ncbi:MAG: asparagine synthase-related protein [Chloroflexota bacterium]|nr:asparagine synthase-related protein [Chloroflexota bacterium]